MKKTSSLALGGMIAALYAALSLFCALFGLANGAIQLRLSEALNVLCLFTPAAVPGIAVGCLLANLLTGCALWDVIFGSLASLLGAWGVWALRKKPLLALLMPVIANSLVIPPLLYWVYGTEGSFWLFTLSVFAGELISCTLPGKLLIPALGRFRRYFEMK